MCVCLLDVAGIMIGAGGAVIVIFNEVVLPHFPVSVASVKM